MTIFGWLFLILSWGFIAALNIFCFYRILNPKKKFE